MIYLGLGPSVVGFVCFSYAIRVLGATRAASPLCLVAFVSALIAWLVLGELPAPLSFVGALVALIGVALGAAHAAGAYRAGVRTRVRAGADKSMTLGDRALRLFVGLLP